MRLQDFPTLLHNHSLHSGPPDPRHSTSRSLHVPVTPPPLHVPMQNSTITIRLYICFHVLDQINTSGWNGEKNLINLYILPSWDSPFPKDYLKYPHQYFNKQYFSDNMSVKLLGSAQSTCTQRVLLVLRELGVEYDLEEISMQKGEHKVKAYLVINVTIIISIPRFRT